MPSSPSPRSRSAARNSTRNPSLGSCVRAHAAADRSSLSVAASRRRSWKCLLLGPLVDRGVELERDLVAAVGEVQRQPAPLATMGPAQHPFGQTEIDEGARTDVEPSAGKSKQSGGVVNSTL